MHSLSDRKRGTTGGTKGGTTTVHLSLYHLPAPTAGYGHVFPRQFAPPLVGRAARPRPSSRIIYSHSIIRCGTGGVVRHQCPIRFDERELGCRPRSGGASDMTSPHRSRPRQVVGPRCSTCCRIDACANAPFERIVLSPTTSLPDSGRER